MTSTPAVRALVRGPRPLHRTIRTRPAAVQGTLALQWQLPGDLDAEPVPAASLRLVTRPPALDADTDPAVAEVPTSRVDLPDPGTWTAQLVQAVLEVLAQGGRATSSCAGWLPRSTPTSGCISPRAPAAVRPVRVRGAR